MKHLFLQVLIGVMILFGVIVNASARVFDVTDYGAKGDGKSLNTISIQTAIHEAFAKGGGTVLVPPGGVYKTGTIQLKSNVTLEVNGTILGTEDTSDINYPEVDPGYESFCTRPDLYPRRVLIYAKNAENVALIGSGIIDGNGLHENLRLEDKLGNRMKAINGIRFMMCRKVTMKGKSAEEKLTVTNTGHWAVNPMNCDNVHIQYLQVKEYGGVTPDGLPLTDSRNVLVEDCYISSDDDACTLKNGSPHIIVSNITVKRTILESGVTPHKFGSPQSFGAFRNIKIIGCTLRKAPEDMGITYKTYSEGFFLGVLNGGGSIDGVLVEDCIIDGTKHPFAIYIANIQDGYWSEWWEGRNASSEFGTVKNVTIRNVSYRHPNNNGVLIEGRDGREIENLVLENIYLPASGGGSRLLIPKEKMDAYPMSPRIYGKLPAYGFFIRHARNVTMKNVWCWPLSADPRECLVQENVVGLDTEGLHAGVAPKNYLPAIYFENIEQGSILSASGPITIKANGRDHDGLIAKVELFANETQVGEVTASPYQWTGDHSLFKLNVGKNKLKLVATDDAGDASSTSVVVTLSK